MRQQETLLDQLSSLLKAPLDRLADKITALQDERRTLDQEVRSLKEKLLKVENAQIPLKTINSMTLLAQTVEGVNPKELRSLVESLKSRVSTGVIALGAHSDGKASVVIYVTPDLTTRISAKDLVAAISPILGGQGGGRDDFAQAGGPHVDRLPQAFEALENTLAHAQV